MTRPRIRRLLLHTLLAVGATPIPGCATVGVRAIQAGRGRLGLALFAAGLGGTALGLGLTLTLPVALQWSSTVVILLWLACGLTLFAIEHRQQLGPQLPAGRPAILERLALWPAMVAITWLPAGLVIALFTSRWGVHVLQKPSMPREVLFVCGVVLAPIGLAVGIGRALLRRPFSIAAPLTYAVALPVTTLAVVVGALALVGLSEDVLKLPQLAALPAPIFPRAGNLAGLAWLATLPVFAAYLADARGAGGFAARTLGTAVLALLACANEESLYGALPIGVRHERALRQASRGDDAAAARSWRWLSRYAPLSDGAPTFVEAGTIAALRAGDRELARDLLTMVPVLARHYPVDRLQPTADALLASPLDPRAIGVEPTLILPERYLSDDWCVALSAVRAALPGLSESRLKRRLQPLSRSSDTLDLAAFSGFDDLRVLARTLELEAWALPFDRLTELLLSGRPALILDPIDGSWRLIYRVLPDADALELIDYRRWPRDERPLGADDAVRLVAAEEHGAELGRRIAVETRSLEAYGRVRARQALDGGWIYVVNPIDAPPAGADLTVADQLTRQSQGRKALVAGAPLAAQQIAGRLPPGPERSELEGLSAQLSNLNAGLYGLLYAAMIPPGATAGEARPFRVDHQSPFALRQLCQWPRLLDAPCAERVRLLQRLHALDPTNLDLSTALLDHLIDAGELGAAAHIGGLLARDQSFDDASILTVLARLAPATGTDPAARGVVAELVGRLQWLVSVNPDEPPTASWFSGPVIAGRAALTDDDEAAVAGWRRAVEIDPGRAAYRTALARALDARGHKDEAAAERRQASLLTGTEVCSVRLPRCKP